MTGQFMYRSQNGPPFGPVGERELRDICEGSNYDLLISPFGHDRWVNSADYFRAPGSYFQDIVTEEEEAPGSGGFLKVFTLSLSLVSWILGFAFAGNLFRKFELMETGAQQSATLSSGFVVAGAICLLAYVVSRRG
ncbi:MAG: hypothetical protein AAF514_00355 [Verrucomicrobiota bacterium]